jgi:hypothetical protein
MGDSKNPPRSPVPTQNADPLMARIDRALAAWPEAQADRAAEGDRAAGIAAMATASDAPEEADGDVLAPPLPRTPDDGRSVRPSSPRPGSWRIASGLAAVAAIAACFVALGVRGHGNDAAPAVTAAAHDPMGGAGVAARPSPAAAAGPGTLDLPGIDPALLPKVPGESAAASTPPSTLPGRRTGGGARVASGATGPVPGDPMTGSAPAALDDSLRPAAGVAPGSGLVGDPSSVPRRPPVGAVQGAFGAVLPMARACLEASDPPYRAMVTFQSDGTVRDVSLPGADPAKVACVRSALTKASVPAFAEGSYAAPVTVRTLGH